MFLNRLRLAALFASLALACSLALLASTRKADKIIKEAAKAEAAKDYDRALQLYAQALQSDPSDAGYQLAERRVRSKVADMHLSDGLKLREQQKFDEALVELQKAYLTDPSYAAVAQEIRNTEEMIRRKARTPANTPVLTPYQESQKEIQDRVKGLATPPVLRPLTNQLNNLRMNNQNVRVLYDTVAKLAGINVLFDSAMGDSGGNRNYNLSLNRVTLSEALDYVALLTHTFWKPISTNAIFVTTDSQQKRQEYQDQVVKVFYLQNVGATAEFQDYFNAVRMGTNITRGLIQLPTQNAIVARGTPDQLAVAEKIIHDLDRARAEVLIDVIVMEVNKTYSRTLSAAIAGATGGLNVPVLFTPRSPTTIPSDNSSSGNGATGTGSTGSTGTGSGSGTTGDGSTSTSQYATLARLGHLSSGDFSTNLPGALVQALMSNSSTKVAQRPQLRATDGGKASLKIGSRIPYVTGSLSAATTTTIPYATTQFQQVDVGMIMEMEPKVNGPDDISLHLKIEVSQVSGYNNISGIQQPIISQRINEANLRLKSGEVSVLGGFTQNSDSLTVNGIPGLMNIPGLSYLFGTKQRDKQQDDVVIAIVPHLVRNPDLSALGAAPIDTGTETNFKVIRSTPGSVEIQASDGGSVGGRAQGSPQSGSQQPAYQPPVNQVPEPVVIPGGVPMQQPYPPGTIPSRNRPPIGPNGQPIGPNGQPIPQQSPNPGEENPNPNIPVPANPDQ